MSKQPAVKPKQPSSKPAGRQSNSTIKDNKPEKNKTENASGNNVDTSQDEEMARMLQEQLYNEQEESDAALARRLHEEERSKIRPLRIPPPNLTTGPGGRPQSATPIQQLFRTLFNMQPQASELEEDDDEDTTPAMEPEAVGGATGASTDGLRRRRGPGPPLPPRQRPGVARSPERAGRGRGRVSNTRLSPDHESTPDSPLDLLPGVSVNPYRRRQYNHPPGRRIYFNINPQNTETEDEGPSEDNAEGAERRVVPPPGLGPREGTMAPPDGEYEPDLMILDSPSERSREDNFVHMMRDPFLLMLLLMGRDPTFMVPDDVDLGDYEALWDLAERLGEVQSRGMKEEEIAKLKPDTYRKRKLSDKDAEPDKCSVCLFEYKNGDKTIKLHCGHLFHQECLTEWLKRNATCPVCRTDVKKPS